jgi:hypothetical protein
MFNTSTIPVPYLKKISNPKYSIFLSQTVRGMSMTQPVKFLECKDDQLILHASNHSVCLSEGQFAYIHSQSLRKPISGKIMDFNIHSGELLLNEISILKNNWKSRSELRVHPPVPLHGYIQTNLGKLRGNIENLSEHGAGLLIHKNELPGETPPNVNQNITLQFTLPNQTNIRMEGKIVDMHSINHHLNHVGLSLKPTPKERQIIKQYLDQAYDSIKNELDYACREFLEHPDTKDLYF